MSPTPLFTVFEGHRRIDSGPLQQVALSVKRAIESGTAGPVAIYDDGTGRIVDIDTRGTEDEVVARLGPGVAAHVTAQSLPLDAGELRGRGRPKLGVIGREVTLLPRHWDWLNAQPGGASVALRRLVDEARRTRGDRDRTRAAQEVAYHFMSAAAGNFAGFEEAARALFANDRRRFGTLVAAWPEDVRDHAVRLAFADLEPSQDQ